MSASKHSPEYVLSVFENTISPDQAVRQAAELTLNTAAKQPGFLPALLSASTLSKQGAGQLQVAAAVFLKNQVERRWGDDDESLSTDDRDALRNFIIPALLHSITSQPRLVPVLLAIVNRLVRCDFPEKWMSALDQLNPMLQPSANRAQVITAVLVLNKIAGWKGYENDGLAENIYAHYMPVLLSFAQECLNGQNDVQNVYLSFAFLLKSILKTAFSVIQYRWSPSILGEHSALPWCTLFSSTLQSPVPPAINGLPEDERADHPVLKAKKWALRCLVRIMSTHGCPEGSRFQKTKQTWPFSEFFMSYLATPVLQSVLSFIAGSLNGSINLTDRQFVYVCEYLHEVIRSKPLFIDELKQHLPALISSFIFPRLCFSDADQERWEDDPLEYARSMVDPFDDFFSLSATAAGTLLDMCKLRKKTVFPIILSLITEVLNRYSQAPSDVSNQRKKDGCLFLIGTLAKLLQREEMGQQVEGLFKVHVAPELSSPKHAPFLRVRALWVIEQFGEMKFGEEATVLALLNGILFCLQDTSEHALPIQVQAACALGGLIEQDAVQRTIPPLLPQIVQSILHVTQKAQVDALAGVLEQIVNSFSDDLTPFACELAASLCDTIMRIVQQQVEASGSASLSDSLDSEDDSATGRIMALIGIMRTLTSLVDGMADSPQLLANLEAILTPLLAFLLDKKAEDVYEEAFELIESFTFHRKTVSSNIWSLFTHIAVLFSATGSDYSEEIARIIDNCVTYDPTTFMNSLDLQGFALAVCEKTLTQNADECFGGEVEAVCGMAEAVILSCRPPPAHFLSAVTGYLLKRLKTEQCDSDNDAVIHLDVILASLFADPIASSHVLLNSGCLETFIAKTSLLYSKFTRVHDKRLLVVGLTSFLSIKSLPEVVSKHAGLILSSLAEAVASLPTAMENRKKLIAAENESDDEKEEFEDTLDSDDYEDLDDLEEKSTKKGGHVGHEVDGAEIEDFEDGDDEGYESEVLEENIYFESPLDKVDIVEVVQDGLRGFASTHPNVLRDALSTLASDRQTIISSIIN